MVVIVFVMLVLIQMVNAKLYVMIQTVSDVIMILLFVNSVLQHFYFKVRDVYVEKEDIMIL